MTVINYVNEEVRRQGHDTHTLDGIERVGWMLDGGLTRLASFRKNRTCTRLLSSANWSSGRRTPGYTGLPRLGRNQRLPGAVTGPWSTRGPFSRCRQLTPLEFYKAFVAEGHRRNHVFACP